MKFLKGGAVLLRKDFNMYVLEKYWIHEPKNPYFLSQFTITKNHIFIKLDKTYTWTALIKKAKSL